MATFYGRSCCPSQKIVCDLCSVESIGNKGQEGGVVSSDVLSALGLGVDEDTLTLVVLLSLVKGALESAGGAGVPVDVVRKHTWVDLLDFGDSLVDLGSVTSSSAVLELEAVGSVSVNLVLCHLLRVPFRL